MLSVRRADPADIGPIKALDPIAQSDPRRAAEIEKAVASGDCHVAESDGSITGYVVLRTDFFGQGFVWLLIVATHQRRQGIGEVLMAAAERACPTEKLFTSTNRSNGPMRGLLAKHSYEEVGTIEGLDEGDPEVFYLKRLAPGIDSPRRRLRMKIRCQTRLNQSVGSDCPRQHPASG